MAEDFEAILRNAKPTLAPKRAIVHLSWNAIVLIPVDEDFEPDHMKIGEGLTPEQIRQAWEIGESPYAGEETGFVEHRRSRLVVTGWTKRERYIPD